MGLNHAAQCDTPAFDARRLRNALGQFATGVSIVTSAAQDGRRVGLTVNSFSSVSLDPPLVLWSLSNRSASLEHFSVDGTMIESYASLKSFQPIEASEAESDGSDNTGFKPRNAEKDFKGQKRSNETHESKTDPEARLARKGWAERRTSATAGT